MSIEIKQATQEDASFLALMILQSSRAGKKDGIFDLIFKSHDEALLLEKLESLTKTKSKSYCHYKNFLIACVNGKPVGTLCSYEPRISTQESFMKALEEISCDCDTSEYLAVMQECKFDQNIRTLLFDFMEELEGFVDVGILKALMQKSLLTARLKGYTIAQTIIEIGSLESELFYNKLGFKKREQKECELYKEKFGRHGLMLLEIEF